MNAPPCFKPTQTAIDAIPAMFQALTEIEARLLALGGQTPTECAAIARNAMNIATGAKL